MEKLLEVKDLSVCFPARDETVQAVDHVSFDIFEGETFGLVGESGCGKSQTLRSILGLLKHPGRVTGGSILYKGQDIVKMKSRELQKIRGKEIALIFQEPMTSLNPVLKIKDQIFEVLKGTEVQEKDADGNVTGSHKITKKEMEQRAVDLLKLVGIPSPETRINEYPHQFSGGMRQRAMIAIALGNRPKLLLADEPTTALDVTIQDQVMKLINQLKEELNMSVILVTHDLGVIAQMCDRVAVMYAGKIVEMTDVVTLFSAPRHPYTYGLMGSLPSADTAGSALETIGGSPPNLARLPRGCAFAPRCRYSCDRCLRERPEITEVEPGHFASCFCLEKTSGFKGLISMEEADAHRKGGGGK